MISFANNQQTANVPTFEELLVKMMPHFEFFAKHDQKLRGDNYDECIQDLTCMAYEMYSALVRNNKTDKIFFSAILNFAKKRFRDGRHFTDSSSVDVFGTRTRLKERCELNSIHMMKTNNDPKEYLVSRKTNVFRTVSFRIDFFETFLPQQTELDQAIIFDLMVGETTNDVSRKYGLSAGRISQLRKKYANDWYSFLYPADEVDLIDELQALAEEDERTAKDQSFV